MKSTYKIILVVFIVASIVSGCNMDVNVDPNRVTETTVNAALIFPAAANEVGQRVASPSLAFIDNWVGYWSGSGTFSIDATETTYNITPGFGNTLWLNDYNTLFDLYQSQTKGLATGDSLIAASSMILSARLWQDVVDVFGSVPYSQAFQFSKYPKPAYDKDQDIYNHLQGKLDTAILIMQKAAPTSSFKTLDIVNGGDQAKWIKFANTLKLRLLIRQSEVAGFSPAAEIAKITANGGGFLQSGETVSVNPGYSNTTNKQSPFYGSFGLTVNLADAAPSVRANQFFVGLLNNDDDPRLYQYFDTLATGNVVGTTYGLASGNPTTSSGNGPGLATSSEQDQWILTSVESLFFQAEAIQRGWLPGDPSTAYTAAITESFIFLQVPNAKSAATDYINFADASNNHPNEFNDNSQFTNKVYQIVYQKYLSLCGIGPIEAWSDLRRLGASNILQSTGYLTVNPGTLSKTSIPARLLYPQDELTANAANVPQGINQFTSKIFWDVH